MVWPQTDRKNFRCLLQKALVTTARPRILTTNATNCFRLLFLRTRGRPPAWEPSPRHVGFARTFAKTASAARMCGWVPSFFATFLQMYDREQPSPARVLIVLRAQASIRADDVMAAETNATKHLEPRNPANRKADMSPNNPPAPHTSNLYIQNGKLTVKYSAFNTPKYLTTDSLSPLFTMLTTTAATFKRDFFFWEFELSESMSR